MCGKALISLLVEGLGTMLGLLFLRNMELYLYIGISLLTLGLITAVSRMDPGTLVPRNDEYCQNVMYSGYSVRVLKEEDRVLGRIFEKKGETLHSEVFCNSCGIFRAPGTSHCRTCDKCISLMDHHCVWLNNCVGERNYPYFMNLLALETCRGVVLLYFRAIGRFPKMKWDAWSFYFYGTLFWSFLLTLFVAALFFYFLWLNVRGTSSRMFCRAYKRGHTK